MSFHLGQPVTLTFRTYSDAAQTDPADPTGLTLTVTGPSSTSDHTWPGDVIRADLGVFTYTYTPAAVGHYVANWQSTGAVATDDPAAFDIVGPLYVTEDDVRGVLGPTGTAASLDDQTLTDAIWEAQTETDGRLAAHYTTPFAQPPALIVNVVRDVAAYLATMTYRRGEPIAPNEPVALRYARAQTLLGKIETGALPLQADATGSETSTPEVVVINPTDTATWTPADFGLAARASRVDSLTTTPWPWP